VSIVTICAPCWNQVEYTKWFVESIRRNSEGHDVGLILLDNGSTDGTREYIRSVNAIRIELEENIGVNPAWNMLLAEALKHESDVIVLANNDIWVGPEWLNSVSHELMWPYNGSYFLPYDGIQTSIEGYEDAVRAALPTLRGHRVASRGGWCMFFTPAMVRRFHPIPDGIKLWFGDDWIHYKLGEAGFRCETLLDCCVRHFLSKSVTELPNKIEIIARDREAFARIMDEERKRRG